MRTRIHVFERYISYWNLKWWFHRKAEKWNLAQQGQKPTRTQATYGVTSGIRTQATRMGRQVFHDCATLASSFLNDSKIELYRLCLHNRLKGWKYWINLGFGNLPTYPSPKPTIRPKWEVSEKCWLGGGVGGKFLRNLKFLYLFEVF